MFGEIKPAFSDSRQLVLMQMSLCSLGIFEEHKLLFSFQITIKLEQDQGHVKQEELDFFIKVTNFSFHIS